MERGGGGLSCLRMMFSGGVLYFFLHLGEVIGGEEIASRMTGAIYPFTDFFVYFHKYHFSIQYHTSIYTLQRLKFVPLLQ